MSILIKGMEMPTSCADCRLMADGWCYSVGLEQREKISTVKRPTWCPLVPVPQHGRLIDADALKEKRHWTDDYYEMEYVEVEDIDDAPTIIPAEPFNNLSKPRKDDDDFPICTKASHASLGIYKKAEEGE